MYCRRRLRLENNAAPEDPARAALAALPGVRFVRLLPGRCEVEYDPARVDLATLVAAAGQAGLPLAVRRRDRWYRRLACWQDRNLRDQAQSPGGWTRYLEQAYLAAATGDRHDLHRGADGGQ